MSRRLLPLCLALASPALARSQAVTERPPLLSGDWVGLPGVVYFNFVHRFTETGAPEHKVINTPTFVLGSALPWNSFIGLTYATNSNLVAGYPNEHEYFLRTAPLAESRGGPSDLGFQGGYNDAAQGADAEASLAKRFGALRVLAVGRVLKGLSDSLGTRTALGGGAVLHLMKYVAVAGDVMGLTKRVSTEKIGWSAGLQLQLPQTPHSVSLQATNVSSNTLQGSSRGTAGGGSQTRYGFEFTIPVTLRRYFGPRVAEAPQPPSPPPTGEVTHVHIEAMAFRSHKIEVSAGTTVEWTNADELGHTVTADDGSFSSRIIQPGQTFSHTFDKPGEYAYHCGPHPFMMGVVVVH